MNNRTNEPSVAFSPLNIVAVIRRCHHCGALVARTFKNGKAAGKFALRHQCPTPPAAAMALAA